MGEYNALVGGLTFRVVNYIEDVLLKKKKIICTMRNLYSFL